MIVHNPSPCMGRRKGAKERRREGGNSLICAGMKIDPYRGKGVTQERERRREYEI